MNLIELYDGWLENISFVPDIEVKTAYSAQRVPGVAEYTVPG